jgi:hypothetical protein
MWHQWLTGLLEEARNKGILRPNTDCDALSRVIVSTLEGAILICKASKDEASLLKTAQGLKSVISGYRS